MTIQDVAILAEELGVPIESLPDGLVPRFNMAPTQEYFVVREHQEKREAIPAKWGLINRWAKDAKRASMQINARASGIESKPAFRDAFRKRRCVVAVDGFYEWFGEKKSRQPFWFHRPDGKLLLMAGLYEAWQPEPGRALQTTYTIITTEANELIANIHDRMPVILSPDDVDAWLFEGEQDLEKLKDLLVPAASDLLVPRAVSQEVNNARFDTPTMVEPIGGVEYPSAPLPVAAAELEFDSEASPVAPRLLP